MTFLWTDLVNGFIADPAPINALGQKVAALDAAFAAQFVQALKLSDETLVGPSTTLQNDDVLFVSAIATATYDLRFHLIQSTNAAAGFSLDVQLPSGSTWYPGWFTCGNAAANEQTGVMSTASISGVTGLGADGFVEVQSVIKIGSTSGVAQIRWAQTTGHASNAIVRAGSWIRLTRIA